MKKYYAQISWGWEKDNGDHNNFADSDHYKGDLTRKQLLNIIKKFKDLISTIPEKECPHYVVSGVTDLKKDFARVCQICGKRLPDVIKSPSLDGLEKLRKIEEIDSSDFFKLCQRDNYFAITALRNKQCEVIRGYNAIIKKLKSL